MTVPWFRSLRFKLFLLMSAYLSFAIGSVSWQDTDTFQDLLTKQNQQHLISVARESGNSVSGILEVWSSLIHAVMHNVDRGDVVPLTNQVKSLLASNKELIAFQILAVHGDKATPVLSAFTENIESDRWGKHSPEEIWGTLKRRAGETLVPLAADGSGTEIDSLQEVTGLPLLQIRQQFHVQREAMTYIAVLVVWQDRIQSLLQKGSQISGHLFKAEGARILSGVSQERQDTSAPERMAPLLRLMSPYGFRAARNADGSPVSQAFARIPPFNLVVAFEKDAREEYDYLVWQIRKIALFSWILLLITGLASFWASGRVTKRIQEAVEATLRIAAGDLQSRVEVVGKDEMSHLALAVNQMAQDLERLMEVQVLAARQEAELRTAQAVQSNLLPAEAAHDRFLQVQGYYRPATECAGDWWGFFPLGDSRRLVVIADATGHGAPAALTVAMVYGFFQTLTTLRSAQELETQTPSQILHLLNEMLFRSGQGAATLTAFLALFDFTHRTLTYANAGHVFPLRVARSNPSPASGEKRITALTGRGSILGLCQTPDFDQGTLKIQSGDQFLFFTDGLTECAGASSAPWGTQGLRRKALAASDQEAKTLHEGLVEQHEIHAGKKLLEDDVTFVTVEVLREQPVDGEAR